MFRSLLKLVSSSLPPIRRVARLCLPLSSAAVLATAGRLISTRASTSPVALGAPGSPPPSPPPPPPLPWGMTRARVFLLHGMLIDPTPNLAQISETLSDLAADPLVRSHLVATEVPLKLAKCISQVCLIECPEPLQDVALVARCLDCIAQLSLSTAYPGAGAEIGVLRMSVYVLGCAGADYGERSDALLHTACEEIQRLIRTPNTSPALKREIAAYTLQEKNRFTDMQKRIQARLQSSAAATPESLQASQSLDALVNLLRDIK